MVMLKSFKDLGVCQEICDTVEALGWKKPTEIQEKVLPLAFSGRDIVGLAETGSGKTAAFAIPILQNLLAKPKHNFALILSPTRELAMQIKMLFLELGAKFGLKIVCLVGGQHFEDQMQSLRKEKYHVIVGTPGRIVYHLQNSKELRLNHVRYLVLDEADQMLEDAFEDHLSVILDKVHPTHKTYMFSATMTQKVEKVQKVCTKSPIMVEVASKYAKVEKLDHAFVFLPDKERDFYLVHLLSTTSKTTENSRAIVFTATWRESFRLASLLKSLSTLIGGNTVPLNGAMQQDKRQASLFDFRTGKAIILVATDLASRGLDFPGVDLVVNYDVPRRPSWSDSAKAYIHRVGRTARAGRPGRAISLVTPYSATRLKAIEEALGERIPQIPWSGSNYTTADIREQIQQADWQARTTLREKDKSKRIQQKKRQRKQNGEQGPSSKSRKTRDFDEVDSDGISD